MEPAIEPATTLRFASAARHLGRAARGMGLHVPGFRSPPRLPGASRTIRRRPGGGVVAVRVQGRPWVAVLADMVEGVVVANRLQGPAADRAREALWVAAGDEPRRVPTAHVA